MPFGFSGWLKDTKRHMRERGQEREREIWSLCFVADCTDKHFADSVHSLYARLCVQSSTWKNAQPGKRLFPSFKRSCMLYMPSQTHPHTNTPINGCSQTPFVLLEFLKKRLSPCSEIATLPLLCLFNRKPSNSPFGQLLPFFVFDYRAAEGS